MFEDSDDGRGPHIAGEASVPTDVGLPNGIRFAVVDGALVVAADPGVRDAVLQDGADRADLLIGVSPVPLPVGSRIQIGPFSVRVEARDTPAPPRQRDDRSQRELLAMLDTDLMQATVALAGIEGPDSPHARVIADAVATARRAVAEGMAYVPPQYSPRLAVLNLLEGLGDEFVGQGRSVRLHRSVVTTPAAMVGLGTLVVLSVQVSEGPASILLTLDGFSRVGALKVRRRTSTQRGVEWRYTDLTHADGYDMSMPRMVGGFPAGAGELLCRAWQQRVLAMIQQQDW